MIATQESAMSKTSIHQCLLVPAAPSQRTMPCCNTSSKCPWIELLLLPANGCCKSKKSQRKIVKAMPGCVLTPKPGGPLLHYGHCSF